MRVRVGRNSRTFPSWSLHGVASASASGAVPYLEGSRGGAYKRAGGRPV